MKVDKRLQFSTLGFAQSTIWVLFLCCSLTISACGGNDDGLSQPAPEEPDNHPSQVETVMNELWETSCLLSDKSVRIANYNTIQSWADVCPLIMYF